MDMLFYAYDRYPPHFGHSIIKCIEQVYWTTTIVWSNIFTYFVWCNSSRQQWHLPSSWFNKPIESHIIHITSNGNIVKIPHGSPECLVSYHIDYPKQQVSFRDNFFFNFYFILYFKTPPHGLPLLCSGVVGLALAIMRIIILAFLFK